MSSDDEAVFDEGFDALCCLLTMPPESGGHPLEAQGRSYLDAIVDFAFLPPEKRDYDDFRAFLHSYREWYGAAYSSLENLEDSDIDLYLDWRREDFLAATLGHL
jgi:hypothetical protein